MIEYSAVTELEGRFRKARQLAPQVADLWLHKLVGPALVTEMATNAPVRTGHLRSQIRQITLPGKLSVGPFGVEYNKFVVEGTKPHTIKAKTGGLLRFRSKGQTVYIREVKHPGTKPNPYMSVSARAVTKRLSPRLMQLQISVIRTGAMPSGV